MVRRCSLPIQGKVLGEGAFELLLKIFPQAAPLKSQPVQNNKHADARTATNTAALNATTFAPEADEVGFSLHASKSEAPDADINLLSFERSAKHRETASAAAADEWDTLPPIATEDFYAAEPVPTLDFDDDAILETKNTLGLNLVAVVAEGPYLKRLHINTVLPVLNSQKVDAAETFHQLSITALHTLTKPVLVESAARMTLGRNTLPAIFPVIKGLNAQGQQIDLSPYGFSREHAEIEYAETENGQRAARITPIADSKKKPLFLLHALHAEAVVTDDNAYLIAGVFVFELSR